MSKIDLLISTMNYTDGQLDKTLATVPSNINVIVVNQVMDPAMDSAVFNIKANVTGYSFNERGLSKSRNRLLSLMKSEFFIISDDDIEFLPGAFDRIEHAFQSNPEQDILTFKMALPNGQPRKRYPAYSYQHDKFSIGKVSSCEIAGKTRSLKNSTIQFDERFGLGAIYPTSEETIFLRDCLRNNLKVRFVPFAISIHPQESTGNQFSEHSEKARGAAFFKLYGKLSYLLGFVFYFRKRRYLGLTIGYKAALCAYLSGIEEFRKTTG